MLIHLPRAIESRRWEVAEACQYLEVPLEVHDFAYLLTTAMTLNPPPGHRERARRGMGCVYACCFAGAQGMGQSHGRLVHIGPGVMGAVTTKTAKCTISPIF